MPLLVLAVLVLAILAAVALTPLMLVQRYRRGTVERRARPWAVGLNLAAVAFSSLVLLAGAAVTALWVPGALASVVMGFALGLGLGALGLALTRWHAAPGALRYTPNRWLVLVITLTVTARLAYGFWRAWQAWGAADDRLSWVVASGAAGSMAAGALVLGYYLAYWAGVRRRLSRRAVAF